MSQNKVSTNSIKNVAVIMDGNGRWAKQRNKPRFWGHIRGAAIVREIVQEAIELSIKNLCLYAFSTENWKRPELEVKTIFRLFEKFLQTEYQNIINQGVRFSVVGDLSFLNRNVRELAINLQEQTCKNTRLNLVLFINYGSMQEIVQTFKILSDKNILEPSIEDINDHLSTSKIFSEIDLMIRTGGEQRLSNFLLWQCSYAELYFSKTLWPDFSRLEFRSIVESVSHRERRFGGLCS